MKITPLTFPFSNTLHSVMHSLLYVWHNEFVLYTHPHNNAQHSNIVQASFQLSVWALNIVCSGSAREAASGQLHTCTSDWRAGASQPGRVNGPIVHLFIYFSPAMSPTP